MKTTNAALAALLPAVLLAATCAWAQPSRAGLPVSEPAAGNRELAQIVQIGFAGPLSGNASQIGKSQQHAVEMALMEENEKGTRIDGKTVIFKLLAQDDRGDPATAALVANYLVKSGVAAVIGHWNTGASVSAGKIYNAAGLAQIAPGSSGYQYTQLGYGNSFRIIGHDDQGGIYASLYAVDTLKAKRIAVIDDDSMFGTMLANQFISGLQQKGVSIVSRHTVSSKTSDFNHALDEINKKNADLIFFGGLGPQAATLMLSIKRMHVNARLLAADGIVSPLYLQLSGAAGEGTYGLAPWQEQEKLPGWKKFREKYAAIYADQVEPFSPFAYDAARMIIAAIRQNNSLAPERIAATLHSMKYKGMTGTIWFDAQGNLNNPAFTIYQVQSGKWTAVQAYGRK